MYTAEEMKSLAYAIRLFHSVIWNHISSKSQPQPQDHKKNSEVFPKSISTQDVNFDDMMDEWRITNAQYWLFMCLVSHVIVVLEPGARFDVRYTRFLRQLNLMR